MKLAPIARSDWLACAALTLLVGLLFLGAPVGGAFDWSDSPRHALNGVFVKDFIANLPLSDPKGFAERYYLQYPALTILFYPPLFYVICAPFYALFGVSQETALLVVELHYIAFVFGAYFLARLSLPAPFALAAAATLGAAPEIAFWGRQVMLEVPAFAFLIWSAYFFARHLTEKSPWTVYVGAALLVLGMYTKLNVAFMAIVFATVLLAVRGTSLFRDKHVYIVGLCAIVGLGPLAAMTAAFGQANVQSVAGLEDADTSRATLQGWLWYAVQLPGQIGWLVVAAGVVATIWLLVNRRNLDHNARIFLLFLAAWFIIGYLFFSAIALKEARHSVFLLPPIVYAIGLALQRVAPPRLGIAVAALIAMVTLAQTEFFRPVHYVAGYAQAAERIAKLAPHNSIVLFSGYRDGAFTFNMRAREDRRDLSVVRADKLLLRIAVRRTLGVEQKSLTEQEIADLLDKSGIHYVVAQPDFWTDLEVMRRLDTVLHSAHFEEVARVPTPSNYPAHEHELVIYRNRGDVAKGPINLKLDLPIIDRTVSGPLGGN